ncbi:hypothetical protein LG3211_3385 [Lysobacter gummosus]|nr:hypothetical protein LG3211_3385 [Lysobacter gummosus]
MGARRFAARRAGRIAMCIDEGSRASKPLRDCRSRRSMQAGPAMGQRD